MTLDEALREIKVKLPWSFKIMGYVDPNGFPKMSILIKPDGTYTSIDDVANRIEDLVPDHDKKRFIVSYHKDKLFTTIKSFKHMFIYQEGRKKKNVETTQKDEFTRIYI